MFYIDPLKEETMSFKPWLAIYHDCISDREMEVVKNLAKPKVSKAQMLSFNLIANSFRLEQLLSEIEV